MGPLEHYRQDLQKPGFRYDPAQEGAVKHLQRLYDDLLMRRNQPAPTRWERLRGKVERVPVKGVYFWGGVGRGKTYLVDTFYETLPFARKMRVHFHRFMRRVHSELKLLQGEKNPLEKVAQKLAAEAEVICFDEFFVTDITDAMILGGLFEKLFGLGVTLVATSNIVPDELYKDGLQRSRFIPAIEQLKRHTEVVNVDSGVDYRLRSLTQAAVFHTPLSADTDQCMLACFDRLAQGHSRQQYCNIEINGRPIAARIVADGILWCDFDALCDGPRSQYDYIEIACRYPAVLVSLVPIMRAGGDDQARRFINMVDEFYDRNVKLILSAEAPIESLYESGRLQFEFARTRSRLLEMQSQEYLGREHRP
ncbi:predicted AFG1-like ATPase [gamma proteobacterium HdN1]|nr:predicted AFG1-like ATPase [gamma proteobacterium HdN1]